MQGKQRHPARDAVVVVQHQAAGQRRAAAGADEPGDDVLAALQLEAAGRHHRLQLQGLQARQRQGTMLDAVAEQQLGRLLAARRVVQREPVVSGTGEKATLQSHQLHADAGAGYGLLQLFVALADGGLQYLLQLHAGIPGGKRANSASGSQHGQGDPCLVQIDSSS
ncbi:hypothetical protein D3C81_1483400 [compost metagenome]